MCSLSEEQFSPRQAIHILHKNDSSESSDTVGGTALVRQTISLSGWNYFRSGRISLLTYHVE